MIIAGVLKQTGPIFAALAVTAALCAAYAGINGDARSGIGLALCSLSAGFVWAMLALTLMDTPPASGPRAGLGIVAVFWLIAPVLASPPFITSGVSQTWLGGLFESISNLTTTGASASAHEIQPPSIRLWRAFLQWLGGSASVAMAISIFSGLDSSAAGLFRAHTPFPVGPHMLQRTAWRIGTVYLAIAGAVSLFMIADGTEPVLAFETAMAAVTTSAALDGTAFSAGPLVSAVLALALIAGATNIVLYCGMTPWRGVWRDPETLMLLALTCLVGFGACLLTGGFDPALFAETLAFTTGSGINITAASPLIAILPAPAPEFLALVGGAALSTTGGLKLIRLLWLGTMVRNEFRVLAVDHATDTRRSADDQALIYMMAYVLAIPILLVGLCLAGAPLAMSLRGAIGALTSHGPLLADYLATNNSTGALILTGLGCVAGRVELLAFAPILGLTRWRFR